MGNGCSRNATAPLKYGVVGEDGTPPATSVRSTKVQQQQQQQQQQQPVQQAAAAASGSSDAWPSKRGHSLRDAAARGDVSALEAMLGPKGTCGVSEVCVSLHARASVWTRRHPSLARLQAAVSQSSMR